MVIFLLRAYHSSICTPQELAHPHAQIACPNQHVLPSAQISRPTSQEAHLREQGAGLWKKRCFRQPKNLCVCDCKVDTALLISCVLSPFPWCTKYTLQGKEKEKNLSRCMCIFWTCSRLVEFFSHPKLIIIIALAAALPPFFILLADPYESIAECLALINAND